MQKSTSNSLVHAAVINREIYILRGQKVMLSSALATLYAVQGKVLMQAVKRNASRFPSAFMFQLSSVEALGRTSPSAPLCFHRAGHRHALERFAQPPRRARQHRHHARVCPIANPVGYP